MENTGTIADTLSRIQELNVKIHMDDFGTGYSSLSYLHRFPIDTLKIDRSFVGSLGMSEDTWKIVQAILSLSQNLGMDVIAEGIETEAQLALVRATGCDRGQGSCSTGRCRRRTSVSGSSLVVRPVPPDRAAGGIEIEAVVFVLHRGIRHHGLRAGGGWPG
jgi:EAL domain-containing protein (putative c-di-GMP-specific phosphodiesterase class I)